MIDIDTSRRELLASLDGLISEGVGLRLMELAASVAAEQAIVEIGSFKGKSTCYLAEGSRQGSGTGVWAIDPWELPGNEPGRHRFDQARPAFEEQVSRAGLRDWIIAIPAFSTVAAASWTRGTGGRPIGMLYIDGSHLYADVRADFEAWLPLLVDGGIIAFDDYRTPRNPGVERFVDELHAGDTLVGWDFFTPPLAIARKP
jgi:predicted O-methyltransferase YrrM